MNEWVLFGYVFEKVAVGCGFLMVGYAALKAVEDYTQL